MVGGKRDLPLGRAATTQAGAGDPKENGRRRGELISVAGLEHHVGGGDHRRCVLVVRAAAMRAATLSPYAGGWWC